MRDLCSSFIDWRKQTDMGHLYLFAWNRCISYLVREDNLDNPTNASRNRWEINIISLSNLPLKQIFFILLATLVTCEGSWGSRYYPQKDPPITGIVLCDRDPISPWPIGASIIRLCSIANALAVRTPWIPFTPSINQRDRAKTECNGSWSKVSSRGWRLF